MVEPPRTPSTAKNVFIGTSLALTVLVMVLLGAWVDRRWGTGPWGIVVGGFIGIVGGLYNLIKQFANDCSNSTPRS